MLSAYLINVIELTELKLRRHLLLEKISQCYIFVIILFFLFANLNKYLLLFYVLSISKQLVNVFYFISKF